MVTTSSPMTTALPAMPSPHAAVEAMLARLSAVPTESTAVSQSAGRILAEPVCADRDSPAADVSAMDGYAVRIRDAIASGSLPIAGEVDTGTLPAALPFGSAMRVFTGGMIPPGADAVVRRESVRESSSSITFDAGLSIRSGDHIRRRGENASAGSMVLDRGMKLSPAAVASAESFGATSATVHRRVRIAVLITGNEVGGETNSARLRDANGPSLRAMIATVPWCELLTMRHAPDEPTVLADRLFELIELADAVLITGGVSMGDHDHVPATVQRACANYGGEAVYHKLSMRPGKPNLGAVLGGNRAVIALPGNPVSVLVGAVVLAGPVLRHLAGQRQVSPRPLCRVHDAEADSGGKKLPMWWYRLGTLDEQGRAIDQPNRGSGDIAGAGRSTGFFEVPPEERADAEPRRWFTWEIDPA